MGFCALLQGIFPTQGSNPGLLHCRQMLCHLSHQGHPVCVCYWALKTQEWVFVQFCFGPRKRYRDLCSAPYLTSGETEVPAGMGPVQGCTVRQKSGSGSLFFSTAPQSTLVPPGGGILGPGGIWSVPPALEYHEPSRSGSQRELLRDMRLSPSAPQWAGEGQWEACGVLGSLGPALHSHPLSGVSATGGWLRKLLPRLGGVPRRLRQAHGGALAR